ncbi:MAG: NADH:ubiquinone reductase (Na(+)-transporting) subunit D [Lentisphaeraceae bacterium]|nr:NADH:ubiquinone reductase (Na(+)-transporting) subunit D [Lentisphaeraceae bacterium]
MTAEPKEPMFSKKNMKLMKDPLIDNNPIAVQVLGICSALAVTAQLKPSVIMAISVTVVIAFSNLIISMLRKMIPNSIRIIVELTIIATLVILVDQVLKAYAFEMSKQLSVFVGLIITNCIVMGRAEAFAMGNKPWPSLLDGLGSGFGYGVIIVIVGFLREVLGSGTLWGYDIIPSFLANLGYVNNGLMVLPPGAFVIIGLIVWLQREITKNYEEH